jgi:hypothetical protein
MFTLSPSLLVSLNLSVGKGKNFAPKRGPQLYSLQNICVAVSTSTSLTSSSKIPRSVLGFAFEYDHCYC